MSNRMPIENDKMIKGFYGEYRFMSNFYLAPVIYEGQLYPSTEHAFQAAKYSRQIREQCLTMTAAEVKRWGSKADLPANWPERRLEVMLTVLRDKFQRHADLRLRLIKTHPKELIELNDWGDRYWGVEAETHPASSGEQLTLLVGENHLGKLLMEVRVECIQR